MLSTLIVAVLASAALATNRGHGNNNNNNDNGMLTALQLQGRCVANATSNTTRLETVAMRRNNMDSSFGLTSISCGNSSCYNVTACVSGHPCYTLTTCASSRRHRSGHRSTTSDSYSSDGDDCGNNNNNKNCSSLALVHCDGLPSDFDGNGDGIPDIEQLYVATVMIGNGNDNSSTQPLAGTITVVGAKTVVITAHWVDRLSLSSSNDNVTQDAPFGGIAFTATNAGGRQRFSFYFNASGNDSACDKLYDVVALKYNGLFKNISSKTTFGSDRCSFSVAINDQSAIDKNGHTDTVDGEIYLLAPFENTTETTTTEATTTTTPFNETTTTPFNETTTTETTTTGNATLTTPPESTTTTETTTTTATTTTTVGTSTIIIVVNGTTTTTTPQNTTTTSIVSVIV